uniref:ATP synthase subunit a n=1 Tax=Ogadenus brumpti TaxID=1827023 RepID=A0A1P8AG83_9ACAR|nr:ATP synthase F0 subunit 6 [Ogadenus brumpti]AMX74044.1 ATP synthase F0 subunit 6 [Ogadenus brumpti]AMX74057.1 ATP synthase F0 subunit 6 [Ogadenus brumpti]
MMTNLFSIFDPSSNFNLSLNWLSFTMIIPLLPLLYWSTPSRLQLFWFQTSSFFLNELKNIFQKKKLIFLPFFLSLFWFILSSNFLGLFPYIFTPTSHLNLSTFMALSIWTTFMLFGWYNMPNSMFTHLVPLGTPTFLSFFMVCIETISNLIRPITLAVRLSANMISGHLLLCLLSSSLLNLNLIFPLISPLLMCLLFLEMAVAIIQSYVFVTLSSLYLNEIN